MIVRLSEVRRLLVAKAGGPVSEDAVFALARALEEAAETFAEESARALQVRNEHRVLQRLPPLKRLPDEAVLEAIRRSNGNG